MASIVRSIVGALAVKLTSLEQQRARSKPLESLEAYDLVLQARDLIHEAERGAKVFPEFHVSIKDEAGAVVARVHKTLYVRLKPRHRPAAPEAA